MDLELGLDGQYAICYQTENTPNRHLLIQKYEEYGLKVRVDTERRWVFLRSTNLEDINRCIDDLGDSIHFRPCKNSRKRTNFDNQTEPSVIQDFTPKHQIHSGNKNKLGSLYQVVIVCLARDFKEEEIRDLVHGVKIYPAEFEKGFTAKLTPYCNVYIKTEEEIGVLCSKLHGLSYKGRTLSVKDVNELL